MKLMKLPKRRNGSIRAPKDRLMAWVWAETIQIALSDGIRQGPPSKNASMDPMIYNTIERANLLRTSYWKLFQASYEVCRRNSGPEHERLYALLVQQGKTLRKSLPMLSEAAAKRK